MDLQEKLNPKWGRLETPRGLPQWTPRMMLDDMEKNGVASVVISPAGPGAWYGDVAGARQICRAWNEGKRRNLPSWKGCAAAPPKTGRRVNRPPVRRRRSSRRPAGRGGAVGA